MRHLISKIALLLIIPLFQFFPSSAQRFFSKTPNAEEWVDSVYNSLSEDQRIGQLFMIRAHSDLGADHIQSVKDQIKNYEVGGLCFFQGTAVKHAKLINEYQALSPNVPLMVAIDAEWGLAHRLKRDAISFPYQLTLGAIQDNYLIYEKGIEVAKQLKRLGIHINFAPVADVNNNPQNPVINFRSFGEDRYNVAVKSYMYMKGMQDSKVMACAKHFPGHGDTGVDSHYDLPVISHGRDRLDSLELYPFKILSHRGVGSMMVAHLNVPALDSSQNRPTTLSDNTVNQLLKKDLEFEGLIFTDGMEMQGVLKHFNPGIAEAEALVAGNDVLLLPVNIDASFKAIKKYLEEGKLSREQLALSVKKILRAKYHLGLTEAPKVKMEGISEFINRKEVLALKEKLIEKSLTLVRNGDHLIPLSTTTKKKIATLSLGVSKEKRLSRAG